MISYLFTRLSLRLYVFLKIILQKFVDRFHKKTKEKCRYLNNTLCPWCAEQLS